jgi:exodeoxyribonuclease V gamma subunit
MTERLAAALGELTAQPIGGPFIPETIVVQGRGMAVWLSHELSRRHGVWANPDFVYPRRFIDRAFRAVLGEGVAGEARVSEAQLVWTVLALLPDLLPLPAFSRLARYLEGDTEGVRRFQLADRIAGRFDHYLTYRPDLVRLWESGDDADVGDRQSWQPHLWRAVSARLGGRHLAAMERELLSRLASGDIPPGLPARVSIFGLSSLPPLYVRIIARLARHVETHVFMFSPSDRDWWNDVTLSGPRKVAAALRRGEEPADLIGHPLVQSCGALGAELQQILFEEVEAAGVEMHEVEVAGVPAGPSTLARLQRQIHDLRVPEPNERAPLDGSISVHACHSPMREVEVLHDQLLSVLADAGGTVSPEDVVVLMPDVDAYAPFVEAVFDRQRDRVGQQAGQKDSHIPYRISDRSVRKESPVIEAFERVLELCGGRARATDVLDLLNLAPVQQRFGFQAADVERVSSWVAESRIRWGIDEDHRAAHGQPRARQNTWSFGLDRMLLGYGMPGRVPFAGVLPFDEIEGKTAALLGNLAEFSGKLFGHLRALEVPRPLAAWQSALTGVLADLCAEDLRNGWQHERVRACLDELGREAEAAGFSGKVSLAALRPLFGRRIEAANPERGFLGHGVTFCGMVPMRSIPFRVVCLLGMNDRAFPRSGRPVDFDLTQTRGQATRWSARPGDRDRRKDDRFLFLETLLAARETLIVTYTGQSIRDNSRRPPSVSISELCDVLGDSFVVEDSPGPREARDSLIVRHPLAAYSHRYFDGADGRLFSYAHASVQGARALSTPAAPREPFFPGPLPAQPAGDEADDPRQVSLAELARFVEDPVAYLLERRLGLRYREDAVDIQDREPLELDPLEDYAVGQALLESEGEGALCADAIALLRAEGSLPLGTLGDMAAQRQGVIAAQIAAASARLRAGDPREPMAIDGRLPSGVRLTGELTGLWKAGLVRHDFARVRPRRLLRLWVEHLALCWQGDKNDTRTSYMLGRAEKGPEVRFVRLVPVAEPGRHLDALVELFVRGRQAPLRFAPAASHAYAHAFRAGKDSAMKSAVTAFNEEAKLRLHLGRVFGDGVPPFGTTPTTGPSFESLALGVWGPLLDVLHEDADS